MFDPSTETVGSSSADSSDVAKTVGRPDRARRTVICVAASLVLVLAVAGIAGALLIGRYDNAVRRDNLLAPSARTRATQGGSLRGPLNLLLIGSDFRTWNPDAGQRSDTIILAHVPRSMDRVY